MDFDNFGQFRNFLEHITGAISVTMVTASTTVTAMVPAAGKMLKIYRITANAESWPSPDTTGVFWISDGAP
jgi:hypothetical protein